jgi:hypothetical protein
MAVGQKCPVLNDSGNKKTGLFPCSDIARGYSHACGTFHKCFARSMEHTGSMLPIIAGSESNRALENEVDQTAADCFDDIDSDECPSTPTISRQLTPKLTFLDVTMVFKRSPPLLRKLASLYHAITFCQVSMRKWYVKIGSEKLGRWMKLHSGHAKKHAAR